MFERLTERAETVARRRAERRARALAGRFAEALPPGIRAEPVDGGVLLEGRGIARRFALEPRLRWMVARLGR